MERYFEKNYTFKICGGTYTITEMIGKGSSCAVYRADYLDEQGNCTEHLLKEYNPRGLSISRTDDGVMCVSAEEQDGFNAGQKRFKSGYEKQLNIRRMSELRNSTSNIQTVFNANGTCYIDMTLFSGSTYSDIREKSLYDLCRRMKAVTQVIGNYHKAGFLHLDIKPDNIFAIPETCEMVMLFDFDSVIEKDNIMSSTGLSYTKTWAAPEQLISTYRSRICEATDLYAIGEMIFWQIFGRHSTTEEHRSFFEYQFDPEVEIFKNVNSKVFPLLSELLHHTIATSVKDRYQSADILIEILAELIKLADPKEPYLVSTKVTAEDFFIGRDDELNKMHEILSEENVLFLCGMGGIGKSELARNYVKQFRENYDTVFFSTYLSSWSMLLTDDSNLQIANFKSYEGEKPEDYFVRKIRKLKELCDERTLFVIDNINEDEYSAEESRCFRQIMELPCRFLFTSRLHEWNYPTLEIGKLAERNDLITLFDKWCPIKNEEQMQAVNEIIDYVDSHTLTLELIAKQTTAGFLTPAKMFEKLIDHGMHDSGKEKVKSDKDLEVSKKTAFEHICDLFDIAELTDGEKYVMANMALIPPTGVEAPLFVEWCEIENADDMNSLIAKGWIDRDGDMIMLHPVVAEVSLNYHYDFELGDTVMLKNAKEYLVENYLSFSPEEKKRYADFSMEMSRSLIASGLCADNVGLILRDISDKYSSHLNPDSVIYVQKYALSLFKKNHGEEHTDVASSLNSLGMLFDDIGDLDTAQQYYEQALSIRRRLNGDEHPDVAATLDNLGILFDNRGDLDTAQQYYEQALEIFVKTEGVNSPNVASSFNNLGLLNKMKGKLDTALQYYNKAVTISKKASGEEHPCTAEYICNLGALYIKQGDLSLAQKYCEEALSIRKKVFGDNHSEVAHSLTSLGIIYSDKGEPEKSLEYYKSALNIRVHLFGEEHPLVANSLHNIGCVYRDIGNDNMALQYLDKAMAINQKLFGKEHQYVAYSLQTIGSVYCGKNDWNTAHYYYEQALTILQNLYGEEHADVGDVLYSLGLLYNGKGDFEIAQIYHKKALFIREKLFGEDVDTADSYCQVGCLYQKKGEFQAAYENIMKGYQIYRKLKGEQDDQTIAMKTTLDELTKQIHS